MHSPKTLLLAALPFLTAVTADCGSLHPIFTLDPINLSSYYTYTTPAASGPKEGQISFSLKNDQVDYTTQCKGVTVQPLGQFYGFQTFDCTSGKPWEQSSFSYDSYSKVINVNSTWTCGGDVVYSTSVSGTVSLQCETSTWTNPDWQAGELYSNISTTCAPGSLVIQG